MGKMQKQSVSGGLVSPKLFFTDGWWTIPPEQFLHFLLEAHTVDAARLQVGNERVQGTFLCRMMFALCRHRWAGMKQGFIPSEVGRAKLLDLQHQPAGKKKAGDVENGFDEEPAVFHVHVSSGAFQ